MGLGEQGTTENAAGKDKGTTHDKQFRLGTDVIKSVLWKDRSGCSGSQPPKVSRPLASDPDPREVTCWDDA